MGYFNLFAELNAAGTLRCAFHAHALCTCCGSVELGCEGREDGASLNPIGLSRGTDGSLVHRKAQPLLGCYAGTEGPPLKEEVQQRLQSLPERLQEATQSAQEGLEVADVGRQVPDQAMNDVATADALERSRQNPPQALPSSGVSSALSGLPSPLVHHTVTLGRPSAE